MKILLCNSFHYLRGGAERVYLDQATLFESKGHEVIRFSMKHPENLPAEYDDYFFSHIDFPAEMKKTGLRSKLRVAGRVIYSVDARKSIEALIADTKPDIAHVHGIAHETSPSILPAIKSAGIPLVQTLHDYKLLCPNTSFLSNGQICERCKVHRYYNVVRYRCKRGSLGASLVAGLETTIHKALQIYERNVDLFIAPSQFLQNKMKEYGIKNRIVNVPNFINLESISPCYKAEDYFIYAGRLSKEKGIKTLFEAMKNVQGSRLYVAGRGELEDDLREFVNIHKLENIKFLGHLPIDQLVSLLQKASFSVVPSVVYENYSMSVLESLAAGTPVIGSNIGGIPEQVRDGWNGLLFETGNPHHLSEKINMILANKNLQADMARNARKQVEKVNGAETYYTKTLTLYEELLEKYGKYEQAYDQVGV